MKRLTIFLLVVFIAAMCSPANAQCRLILPTVVYQNAWLGQTSTIAPTVVYTTPSKGLYRVTVGQSVSGGIGADVITELSYPSAKYTGSYISGYCWADSVSGPLTQTCTVLADAGLQFTFDTRNLVDGTTYDAYVTIEQVQ